MNLGEKLHEALKEHISNKQYNGIPIKDTRQLKVLNGPAFFPVGNGVFNIANHPDESKIRIMILGQDFGTEADYKKVKTAGGSELKAGVHTWKNLIDLIFKETNIDPSHCFYTNAIMGLREAPKNTGRSKAFLKSEPFAGFCKLNQSFFIDCQMNEFTGLNKLPKLIIALGSHVPGFLAGCYEEFSDLKNVTTLKGLDEKSEYHEPVFIKSQKAHVVFITHPSMFQANTGRRKVSDLELISKGLKAIGYKKKIS